MAITPLSHQLYFEALNHSIDLNFSEVWMLPLNRRQWHDSASSASSQYQSDHDLRRTTSLNSSSYLQFHVRNYSVWCFALSSLSDAAVGCTSVYPQVQHCSAHRTCRGNSYLPLPPTGPRPQALQLYSSGPLYPIITWAYLFLFTCASQSILLSVIPHLTIPDQSLIWLPVTICQRFSLNLIRFLPLRQPTSRLLRPGFCDRTGYRPTSPQP